MDNKREVAVILKATTFILALLRFKPDESVTQEILVLLKNFYQNKIIDFREKSFLDSFKSTDFLGDYESFLQAIRASTTQIIPTDNLDEIARIQPILCEILEYSIVLCTKCRYSQLSDLLDAVHALPEALLFKDVWNSKDYWRTYFRPYCKKWDRRFLRNYKKFFIK